VLNGIRPEFIGWRFTVKGTARLARMKRDNGVSRPITDAGAGRAGDVDEKAHWFPLTALADEKTLVLCWEAAFSVLETGGH
jgi:hypothetical protein